MQTKLSLIVLLLVAFLLGACGSGPTPTPPPIQPPTAILPTNTPLPPPTATLVSVTATQPEKEPVNVSALCTLMGRPKETRSKAGEHVFLIWGWSATTPEYVQLFIDKAVTVITFNGQEVTNAQMGQIDKVPNKAMYAVKWKADVGILAPGTYEITYKVTFIEQISDGMDTYGPGGKVESLNDACTLIVE
jgi:hypothetical protein